MRKNYSFTQKMAAILIAALLTFTGSGGAAGAAGQEDPDLPQTGQDTYKPQTEQGIYPQLTADDIVRLDEGDAELIYDDEGKVTFIRGRYSPERVLNEEDAADSLNYVSGLLGLTKGALLFCVYKGIDYTTGYTCYLFLQRDGDVTIVNAAIKIYVDPEGYTAALSCSFNPSTGIREETPGRIDAEKAEQVVRDTWKDYTLTIYPETTRQTGILEDEQLIHVWSVYSNNPEANTGGSDLPYLQHFVSYSGRYLLNLPASSITMPLLEDDALVRQAKAMFDGYRKESWTGTVTWHDGSSVELTVPVARSLSDERYYLMDLDRKILVADYREWAYGSGEYIISSSDTNSGWKDKDLIAMYNIGRVYDYYADHGYPSVDGCGIPLAILSGVCESDGTAIDNAFFNGFLDGFGIFAISDINNTVECLDIMGHEFTHGITTYSMGGNSYVNKLGAINEAFSDIMGNLCELTYSINDASIAQGKTTGQFDITGISLYGSSDDPNPKTPDWRIGEMGGNSYRDLSRPVNYRQPAFVGDAYYCLPTGHANAAGNDYGGVHENSSLLGSIAWDLNEAGLNYERQYSLWMTAMNMMTPKSDYDDVLQALIFARKTYGWDDEIDDCLEQAFAKRGLLEDSHSWSRKWDGVSFTQYNADVLTMLNPGEHQTQQSEAAQDGNLEDVLNDLLTGGARKETELTDQSVTEDDGASGSNQTPDEASGSGWLAGVSLDSSGRIAREGFGRIDFDTDPADQDILVGVIVLEPYTYATIAVNCPDENGHVSFLLPEGSYWVSLCVSRSGPNQTEYWPYTKNGKYEKMGSFALFGAVAVKGGQVTALPIGDVD